MNGMSFGDFASACVERKKKVFHKCLLSGHFRAEVWRRGDLVQVEECENGIVNAGLNYALGVIFRGDATSNPFYISFVDNSGGPTYAAADTMASHAGWSEFTAYSEATRVDWGEDAQSGQSVTNSSAAVFNITGGAATLDGIFVVDQNTKGGATGTLWSTAEFTAPLAVTGSDVVNITYTVNAV